MIQNTSNPIWILVTEGQDIIFEGHQGHWADCFFSNACESIIRESMDSGVLFKQVLPYVIREMTDDEVAQYPESLEFRQHLIQEYGSA